MQAGSQLVPEIGTIERRAFDFVAATTLAEKFAPFDAISALTWESDPPVRRIEGPGRPAELEVVARAAAAPKLAALTLPAARARLFHTFAHHELQAAELFAWALLAFPDTPRAFRRGLIGLCREELAHCRLYVAHMRTLGLEFGALPVRDWFWNRVGVCADPKSFVALLGLGFEAANLEHTARYAARCREVGDLRGAEILAHVEREEIGHVAFALHWFEHFSGAPVDFDRWRAALPPPLTPALMQGRPLNRAARRSAGLDDAFLVRLAAEPDQGARRENSGKTA